MSALDASVIARSAGKEREIACAELFESYFTTALSEDEIIAAVLVAPLPKAASWGLSKFARKVGEFAESVAVAVLCPTGQGAQEARVWLGGAASTPIRLDGVERALTTGAALTQDDVLALVGTDLKDTAACEDEYRKHLHGVTTWRAVTDALERPADTTVAAGA